jgi:hypothetical protein
MSKRERSQCIIKSDSMNDFCQKARKQEISEGEDDFIEIFVTNFNIATPSSNSRIDIQKLNSVEVSQAIAIESKQESESENENIY